MCLEVELGLHVPVSCCKQNASSLLQAKWSHKHVKISGEAPRTTDMISKEPTLQHNSATLIKRTWGPGRIGRRFEPKLCLPLGRQQRVTVASCSMLMSRSSP